MEEDIYRPPLSEVEVEESIKGSPVKAIAAATALDIIGTMIIAIVFNIAYTYILAYSGYSLEEITANMQSEDELSFYSLSGYILGSMMTVIGGYVCARIVNYSEYRFVAIYCVIIIIYGALMSWGSLSATKHFFLLFLTISCAYAGAWLYVKRKKP